MKTGNILGQCFDKYPVKCDAKYPVKILCRISCENSVSALAFQMERNGKCYGGLQASIKASISLFWASAIFVDFNAVGSVQYLVQGAVD